MINMELYDAILLILHYMLSVTCMRTHTTLFVRNIHMLDINNKMNRLLSFKNDLVIVDTHLLLWGENALSFLMITFRSHNKLSLT